MDWDWKDSLEQHLSYINRILGSWAIWGTQAWSCAWEQCGAGPGHPQRAEPAREQKPGSWWTCSHPEGTPLPGLENTTHPSHQILIWINQHLSSFLSFVKHDFPYWSCSTLLLWWQSLTDESKTRKFFAVYVMCITSSCVITSPVGMFTVPPGDSWFCGIQKLWDSTTEPLFIHGRSPQQPAGSSRRSQDGRHP